MKRKLDSGVISIVLSKIYLQLIDISHNLLLALLSIDTIHNT